MPRLFVYHAESVTSASGQVVSTRTAYVTGFGKKILIIKWLIEAHLNIEFFIGRVEPVVWEGILKANLGIGVELVIFVGSILAGIF